MEISVAGQSVKWVAADHQTNQLLKLSSGISLNVLIFDKPLYGESKQPGILFLPGLGSVYENFHETVEALVERHTVYFLETREKGSSVINGEAGFSIAEIASDLPEVVEILGLRADGYIIAGYSLGSAVAVSALKHLRKKPKAMVLVEPSATFPWPWWLPPLSRVAVPLYPVLKPFLKWYMKKFHINEEGDYEMYEINARILDQADPKKLARTVVDVSGYEIRDDLSTVDVPVLVIGVSQDKFHSHDEASNIAQAIPGSSYVDVETNKRSHSAEVADILAGFILDLNGSQKVSG
ncbi:MAG: alpha/beta hydrolase [Bacteroidales bacterium]